MSGQPDNFQTIQIGVVVRRAPGATRWVKRVWHSVAVLPGAGPARWRELRREGEAVEYHAATLPLVLHRSETEAYLEAITAELPGVWVVMRRAQGTFPFEVSLVTASPYEAQDYADGGEDLVGKVAMPPGLFAWVQEFVARHHQPQEFSKRRRKPHNAEAAQLCIGDPRIEKAADVYSAPAVHRARLT